MLATTGWTAVRHPARPARRPRRPRSPPGSTAASAGTHAARPRLARRPAARLLRLAHRGPERAALADRYPLVVGNLNGAPVDAALPRQPRSRSARPARSSGSACTTRRLTPAGQHEAGRRMHRYESLMSDRPPHPRLRPGRRAAGSPRSSATSTGRERVSVVVPGVDTDLLTFQRTGRKYSAPVGMAQSLYAAERAASPATRTAVIAWADYTSPAGLGIDSATAMLAADGAVRLNALVRARCPAAPRSRCSATATAPWCAASPRATCRTGWPTSRWPAAPACGPRTPPQLAHLRPGVGDAGRRRLDPGRAATWRSAGSGTAPTRCRRRSARGCCPRAGADRPHRLLRAGHGEPAQLRRDRRRRVPHGAAARAMTKPAGTGLSGTTTAGRA